MLAEHPSRDLQIVARLRARGARPAVLTASVALTYDELADRVEALAARLGCERRLVLVGAQNDLPSLVAYLGALHGGHAVLLSSDGDALARLLDSYDPDVVLTSADHDVAVNERRAGTAHALHPDLALLLSTSGTTGSTKLVRLSHRSLDANAAAIGSALGLTAADRAITSLPMHYCYGLSVINSHLLAGASLIVSDASVVDDRFWAELRAGEATSFAGVPYTFDLLDRVGFADMSIPHLRYVTQAGGRLAPDRVRRYAELGRSMGWDLVVMYGQTEATARMAYLPPQLAIDHPASIGHAIPGGTLRLEPVVGATPGTGELVYEGPNVMLGYAAAPADLALGATVPELRTGDLARQTPEGLFEIVGRASRFVKVLGLRVDLDQIEAALAGQAIAALCAGDDDGLVIAVEDGVRLDVVQRIACTRVGLPAARVDVVAVSELPRTPSGKADYAAVARLRAERRQTEPETVRSVFADVLQLAAVDGTATFVELGGDSLSYVEASMRLEEVLGQLPPSWHTTSVSELEGDRRPPSRLRSVEANVLLRATAIALVVATHIHLVDIPGGAHLLLVIAGYNFARFALASGRLTRGILRIAVPSATWIAAVALVSDEFSLTHAIFLNAQLGAPSARWGYWFVEAIVQLLVPLAVLLTIPAVRRLERSAPFACAWAVLIVGLLGRSDVHGLGSAHHRIDRPNEVLWLFATGWVAARATTARQRAWLCAVVAAGVPSFFGEGVRELVVLGGIAALVWIRQVRVPAVVALVAGALAGASLYVYLVHWQVFPLLQDHLPAAATWVITLAVGVAVGRPAQRVVDAAEQALGRVRARSSRSVVTAAPAPEGLPA